MTLRKKNERALKGNNAPCPMCGDTLVKFYNAYCDTDFATVRIEANAITRHIKIGEQVPYAYVHRCYRKRLRSHFEQNAEGTWVLRRDSQDTNDDDPFTNEQETNNVPAVVETSPVTSGDMFGKALEQFMGATVEKIARSAAQDVVKETAFPVKTVVIRDNVQTELPGTTHKQLSDCIIAANNDPLLMVGMAGTGKSRIASDIAKALGVEYMSISLTSMTPASALTGMVRAEDITKPLFRQAWEHGNALFNFDEMDHGHPNILGVVNEALANGTMAFPDGMVPRGPNLFITGTANTYGRGGNREYVGANQLDAATIDRFFTLDIEVDEALEAAVAYSLGADNETVDKVLKLVRTCRRNAVSNGLRFLATPRATFRIIKNVRDGMDWDTAVNGGLRQGAANDMWTKLTA